MYLDPEAASAGEAAPHRHRAPRVPPFLPHRALLRGESHRCRFQMSHAPAEHPPLSSPFPPRPPSPPGLAAPSPVGSRGPLLAPRPCWAARFGEGAARRRFAELTLPGRRSAPSSRMWGAGGEEVAGARPPRCPSGGGTAWLGDSRRQKDTGTSRGRVAEHREPQACGMRPRRGAPPRTVSRGGRQRRQPSRGRCRPLGAAARLGCPAGSAGGPRSPGNGMAAGRWDGSPAAPRPPLLQPRLCTRIRSPSDAPPDLLPESRPPCPLRLPCLHKVGTGTEHTPLLSLSPTPASPSTWGIPMRLAL